MRLFLCGGVAIEVGGRRLPDAAFAGRQGRLVFAYLVCERHRSVPREELAELLWGESLPSSWSSSLSAVVSKLRRMLTDAGLDGPAALASAFGSYRLHLPDDTWIDWEVVSSDLEVAERAVSDGQTAAALAAATEIAEIAGRGFLTDDCLWADSQREQLRDMHVRAAHVRAEAHLLAGEQRRAVEVARDALALDEFREASYRLLMRALATAGERGEALRVWERCRTLLVEELGTDPATETEAVYLCILGDVAPAAPPAESLPSGVVTFLLTDIVDSTGLWERNPSAMSTALERHDQLVADTVGANAGVVLKAKLEGDATVSVFRRASAGALAALALREALLQEPWPEGAAPAVRMALHTGEAIERDGDYFGPALNRAARLRGLADGGQILVSQAVAEVVRDHLPEETVLRSLGERALRGLTRDEHVFELAPLTADDIAPAAVERPALPMVLAGRGPFVGRVVALDALATEWATALAGTARAMFIAGEPGVGKTRLAGESARRAYNQGALVLYGRCDEELGAPYQPFAEALRALVGCLGPRRLRSVRGVEELARLVPDLADLVPGLATHTQASPDTERYALFDAVARLLTAVSAETPVLVVVDDLHWAAKPTLLLLRHLLRSAEGARILVVGTYRHTDLDRTHPLAGTLADIHSDGTAERFTLTGLPAGDVTEYLSAAGYDDEHLGAALSTVTSGNPFFLIEVLRHVAETGGAWNPNTLPQGIREAVGRRLSRLSDAANDALLVAAVTGSRFSVALVERVLDRDLVDAIGEACRAGLIVEEDGGWCRFDHALVRQSLLTEIASLKLVRLHQRIAEALEAEGATSNDDHLADLARHYFECALAGGAAKAVDYSRRAAEQASSRLAYEEAADFYDRALQAADIDATGLSDDDKAELLLARCEALLAAGDPTSAIAVVEQLQLAARASPRLSAWATGFAGQLAVLTHPERLDATAQDVAAAAEQFALMDDPDGEAKAHTVRALCLARLGRVADCEAALDRALTAGRRAGDPRRVNAVLAGAPLAALWGPSPVARASGRCLDVVRVLRITTGSPAVEAVALRCQAVLEALRGRADAARRMLGSAHRSLESLGHTHGLLETDLFSGMVELLAGEPAAAETPLRRAYEGFVTRGVGVDAAQAAALLARSVLAQGRVDEALALTDDSERLAGVDLQSAIAWRSARAEALVQQGRTDEALDAARTAVALADPTDALIYQADAHLALAIVLRSAGSATEAASEARLAIDLYERKGATARVDAVQSSLNPPASTPSAPVDKTATRRRVRPNLATEVQVNSAGPFGDQTVGQWMALVADDYVDVDHRTQLTTGRRAYERTVRMWAQMDEFTRDVEPLASLGDRHALVRDTLHMKGTSIGYDRAGPVGAAEIVLLSVVRTDQTGRLVRVEHFDNDELHLALARLIELHADDELPPEQHDAQHRIAEQYRFKTVDWSNSDAVLVDHRPASLGTLRGDEIRAAVIALRSLGADLRRRMSDVLGFTEHVSLLEVLSEGTTEDGGPVELAVLALTEVAEDGEASRWDWYGLEQADEALARFDELAGTPAVTHLANTASVEIRRLYDALLRRDLEGTDAATADNAVIDDRRTLVAHRSEGHDAVVTDMRSVVAAGVTDIDVDILATRGDLLVLERELYRGRDGETEALFVLEITPDRQFVRGCVFDPEDLDAAFDELDARYAAGEGAPFAEAWSVTTAVGTAYNARDWDALRSLFTEDLSCEDHRPAGWGTLDGDGLIRTLRGLVELSGNVRFRMVAIPRLTDRGALVRCRAIGNDETGGEFDIEWLGIWIFAGGRIRNIDFFPVDDLAPVLARFESLVGASRPAHLANTASVELRRLYDAMLRGDFASASASTADDAVIDDRRSLLGHLYEGREAAAAHQRSVIAAGVTDIEADVLATRGDLVVLERDLYRGSVGETEVLFVGELASDFQFLGGCVFDAGDLDAAFDELDARYAASEGAPFTDAWAVTTAANAAYNARDWDAYQALLADDFVTVDHRTAGWGTLDREAFLRTMSGLVELAPDARIRHRAIVRQANHGGITVLSVTGTDATGGPFEIEALALRMVSARRFVRQEFFAVDDLAAACERFEALTTPTADSRLSNSAVRDWAELMACFRARDWDGLSDRLTDDATADDRRSLVGRVRGVYEGRDASVAMWREFAAVGVTDVVGSAVATRGDRLVLQRALFVGGPLGGEGEVEVLLVLEFDDQGRYLAGVSFDPDDLDAAVAELDARYAAGEGAPRGELTGSSMPDGYLINDAVRGAIEVLSSPHPRPDWDWYTDMVAEEVVLDDRRRYVGFTAVGRDEVIEFMKAVTDVGVTEASTIPIATRGDRLAVLRHVYSGAAGEVELLNVWEFGADGRWRALVSFDPDDLDAAFAELDERFAFGEAARYPDEWGVMRTFIDAANRGDSSALASLATDDFAVVDHRSMGLGEVGGAAMQDYIMSTHTVVSDHLARYTAIPRIATGRVMCVVQLGGTTAEGAEIEIPYLSVVSLRGRKAHRLEMFPLEQTDDAYEVFEALTPQLREPTTSPHAADTSALENTASVISRQFLDLGLAHDWQAFANMAAPHVVRVDRRAGLRSEYVGRDQGVAENQFIFAAVRDLATAVVATRGDRLVLTSMRGSGTTDDGGELEFEVLWLGEIDADDQIVRIVWFDADDLGGAIAELDDRYTAVLPGDQAEAWKASRRLVDYYNARDSEALRAILSDDCVIVDERLTGWGTLDAAAFVGHLQELIDLAPDASLMCVVVHSTAPNGSVVRFRVTGTIPGGGPFEMLFEVTSIVRDAKLVRLDLLPEGQVDEALRRLSKPAP